jgi:hypothetical protein
MSVCDSAGNAVVQNTYGQASIVSLNAVSAVSNGTALNGLVVRANAVLSVALSSTATWGTVVLQASLDGQNWWNTSATISPTAAGTTSATVANVFAQYVRAFTVAIAGTGSPTVIASVGVSG